MAYDWCRSFDIDDGKWRDEQFGKKWGGFKRGSRAGLCTTCAFRIGVKFGRVWRLLCVRARVPHERRYWMIVLGRIWPWSVPCDLVLGTNWGARVFWDGFVNGSVGWIIQQNYLMLWSGTFVFWSWALQCRIGLKLALEYQFFLSNSSSAMEWQIAVLCISAYEAFINHTNPF